MTTRCAARRLRTLAVFGALLVAAAPPLSAQSPSPPSGEKRGNGVNWTIAAGYSSTSLRDIARTGPPVDASPVALVGRGPAVVLRVEWGRASDPRPGSTGVAPDPKAGPFQDQPVLAPTAVHGARGRLHRVQAVFLAAAAEYESPIRSRSLQNTTLGRFEGSYEYRRYVFRNLVMDGLDLGLGVEGSGGRQWLYHQLSSAIDIHDTELQAGLGGVVAARLRRWQRILLEAAWVNGGALVHSNQHYTSDVSSSYSSFGGGWVTSLQLIGEVRIAHRASLAVEYVRDDGGLMSTHHGLTSCGRQLTAGVTYGR